MSALIGTWQIKRWYRQKSTGERVPYFGRQPQGRLTYTADGRVHAILVSDDRPHLAGIQISGPDKIRLFDSMISYSGTYEILGDQVIHTVDISWNEAWSGQKPIRFFKFAGDELHISAAPSPDLLDGEASVYIVEWQRLSRTGLPPCQSAQYAADQGVADGAGYRRANLTADA